MKQYRKARTVIGERGGDGQESRSQSVGSNGFAANSSDFGVTSIEFQPVSDASDEKPHILERKRVMVWSLPHHACGGEPSERTR